MTLVNIIVILAIVAALLGSFVFVEGCRERTARGLLQAWARRSGFEIISADIRQIETGPFLPLLNGHVVLRFRALDSERREISGWARARLAYREKFEVHLD